MSGASERANVRASGPVLTSGFLVDLAHGAAVAVVAAGAAEETVVAVVEMALAAMEMGCGSGGSGSGGGRGGGGQRPAKGGQEGGLMGRS